MAGHPASRRCPPSEKGAYLAAGLGDRQTLEAPRQAAAIHTPTAQPYGRSTGARPSRGGDIDRAAHMDAAGQWVTRPHSTSSTMHDASDQPPSTNKGRVPAPPLFISGVPMKGPPRKGGPSDWSPPQVVAKVRLCPAPPAPCGPPPATRPVSTGKRGRLPTRAVVPRERQACEVTRSRGAATPPARSPTQSRTRRRAAPSKGVQGRWGGAPPAAAAGGRRHASAAARRDAGAPRSRRRRLPRWRPPPEAGAPPPTAGLTRARHHTGAVERGGSLGRGEGVRGPLGLRACGEPSRPWEIGLAGETHTTTEKKKKNIPERRAFLWFETAGRRGPSRRGRAARTAVPTRVPPAAPPPARFFHCAAAVAPPHRAGPAGRAGPPADLRARHSACRRPPLEWPRRPRGGIDDRAAANRRPRAVGGTRRRRARRVVAAAGGVGNGRRGRSPRRLEGTAAGGPRGDRTAPPRGAARTQTPPRPY